MRAFMAIVGISYRERTAPTLNVFIADTCRNGVRCEGIFADNQAVIVITQAGVNSEVGEVCEMIRYQTVHFPTIDNSC